MRNAEGCASSRYLSHSHFFPYPSDFQEKKIPAVVSARTMSMMSTILMANVMRTILVTNGGENDGCHETDSCNETAFRPSCGETDGSYETDSCTPCTEKEFGHLCNQKGFSQRSQATPMSEQT